MGGILDIAIQRNPRGEWDESKGDHHTDLGIEPIEWEKLFLDTLRAPEREIYSEGENISEYYERQKNAFMRVLAEKGYFMLGRIWNVYRDVVYCPSEISKLLAECIEIQRTATDPKANSALSKLIKGCQDALETKSGLVLLSD